MTSRDKDIENCIPSSLQRNRYFFGKMMTVQDFEAEADYNAKLLSLSHRLLSGWGILFGLGVKDISVHENGEVKAEIEPGVACDGWGRTIVVPRTMEGVKLPVEGLVTNDGFYDLLLEYDERTVHPVPALVGPSLYEGSTEDNRVIEYFKLKVIESRDEQDGLDNPPPDRNKILMQEKEIVITGEGKDLRITRFAPRYIYKGETFAVRLHMEPGWPDGKKVLRVDELGGISSVKLLGAFFTDNKDIFLTGDYLVSDGEDEGIQLESDRTYDLVYYLQAVAEGFIRLGHHLQIDDEIEKVDKTKVEVISGLKADRVLNSYGRRKYSSGGQMVSEPGITLVKFAFDKGKKKVRFKKDFMPTFLPSHRMLLSLLKHDHDHVAHATQADNAHRVDGYHVSTEPSPNALLALDNEGKLHPDVIRDADTVDGYHASTEQIPGSLLPLDKHGKLPTDITGDADTVNGYRVSAKPVPGSILPLDANGLLPTDITGDADTVDGMHANDIATHAHTHHLKLNGVLVYDEVSGIIDANGECLINAPNPVTVPLDNKMIYMRGSMRASVKDNDDMDEYPDLGDPMIIDGAPLTVENEGTAWKYIPSPIVWQNPEALEFWSRSDPKMTLKSTIGPVGVTLYFREGEPRHEKKENYIRANLFLIYTVGTKGLDFFFLIKGAGKGDPIPEGTNVKIKYMFLVTWEDVRKGIQNAVIYRKDVEGNPVVRVVKFSGKLDAEKGINAVYPDASGDDYGIIPVDDETLSAMFQREFEAGKDAPLEWETQVETHYLMTCHDNSFRTRLVMVGKPVRALLWAHDLSGKKLDAKLVNEKLGIIDVGHERGIIEVGCLVNTQRAIHSIPLKLVPNFTWKRDDKSEIVGVELKKEIVGVHVRMDHPEHPEP